MRVRTLVVDDSPACLASIFLLLERMPVLALTGIASDLREALRHLKTQQVDLVLLDVKMPEMDGLEAANRILSEHPKVQVIMLTESTEVTVQECLASGARGCVRKADVAKTLLPAIYELFDLKEAPHWSALRL